VIFSETPGGNLVALNGATGTVKLTVHVGRGERTSGQPTFRALCDLFHRHGFDCAAAFLGVDGTVGGDRRRAAFFRRNVGVPVLVIAVGPSERVVEVLPEIERMTGNPRPILERAQVASATANCSPDPRRHWLPTARAGRCGKADGAHLGVRPARRRADPSRDRRSTAAPSRRSRRDRAGRVWGFHGDRKPHGDKLFELGRQVPVATIVVDGPERIAASFDVIDELTTRHGVVTTELVPALVSIDGGERRGGTALGSFDL
jgi:PII-like signaling protein